MLRPYPLGPYVRAWRQTRFFDQHEVISDAYGAVHLCRFCMPHRERGLYDGQNNRMDMSDMRYGWWECDDDIFGCIFSIKDGTMMTAWKRCTDIYAYINR